MRRSSSRRCGQKDLRRLLNSLPNTAEFDPIAKTIAEFSPKLAGIVTKAVVIDLQSRDASFKEASSLLTQVSTKADNDARTLSFEQPKLIAAALTESFVKLDELRAAAKAENYADASSKVEALVALVEHIRTTIKTT